MRRRLFLTAFISGGVATVAGCTGSDGGDGGTDDPGGDTGDDTTGDGDGGDDQVNYSDAETLLSFAELGDHDPPYFDENYQELSGQGSENTDEISVERSLTAFAGEHDGSGTFETVVRSSEGGSSTLFEGTDEFAGAAAVAGLSDSLTLDVEAGGDWRIIVANPQSGPAETRRPPVSASGSGHQLVGPIAVDGTTTVTASHDGESQFVAILIDEMADAAIDTKIVYNEVGNLEGEQTELNEDTSGWIDIFAEGEWTLEFE